MDRQKIVVIFGIALLSAGALTWFLYANTFAPKQEKTLTVLAAQRDLPVGTLLKRTDLKKVRILEKDLTKGALLADKDALGRVLLYPVSANETLTFAKVSGLSTVEGVSATIDRGYRAVSVQISDVSGVSGLIQPSSRVDVLFTRPGNMAEAITSTILQNVKVLAIGRNLQSGQPVDPKAPKATVATLVVTPQEAQKLELAKNQGKISLALRNPLDDTAAAVPGPVTTEVLDPMVSARLVRARRGRTTRVPGAIPNLDDPKIWQELTGEKKLQDDKQKEEEARRKRDAEKKPRVVVDVFRGDKHVQESFQ
jgi:pilus assembly protein CpaB